MNRAFLLLCWHMPTLKKKKLISVSPLSLLSEMATGRTGSDSISSSCFHVHSLFTAQPTQLLLWRNPLYNSRSPLAFLFRASRKITAHSKWVYIVDPVGHQGDRSQVLSCWPPERHIKSCRGFWRKLPKETMPVPNLSTRGCYPFLYCLLQWLNSTI